MTHKLGCEPCSFPGNRRLFKARTSGCSLLHQVHMCIYHCSGQHKTTSSMHSVPGATVQLALQRKRLKGSEGHRGIWLEMPVTNPVVQLLLLEHQSALSSTVRFSVPPS